jgi:hypothetical protein
MLSMFFSQQFNNMYGLGSEWCLPRSIARRVVAAHQKVSSTAAQCDLIWPRTKGEPATDLAVYDRCLARNVARRYISPFRRSTSGQIRPVK